MAIVVGSLAPISGQAKSHRTATIPNALTGSFATQNTNNNEFKLSALGKGRLAIAVDNAPNKSLVVVVYGMHAIGAAVGDAGVFQIGTWTVPPADKSYQTVNDPFPFYLIRLTHSDTPTDSPAKTVTLYVTPSAF